VQTGIFRITTEDKTFLDALQENLAKKISKQKAFQSESQFKAKSIPSENIPYKKAGRNGGG
jgi:hypothetical protein